MKRTTTIIRSLTIDAFVDQAFAECDVIMYRIHAGEGTDTDVALLDRKLAEIQAYTRAVGQATQPEGMA